MTDLPGGKYSSELLLSGHAQAEIERKYIRINNQNKEQKRKMWTKI
jgi:hypothetical protein